MFLFICFHFSDYYLPLLILYCFFLTHIIIKSNSYFNYQGEYYFYMLVWFYRLILWRKIVVWNWWIMRVNGKDMMNDVLSNHCTLWNWLFMKKFPGVVIILDLTSPFLNPKPLCSRGLSCRNIVADILICLQIGHFTANTSLLIVYFLDSINFLMHYLQRQ